MISRYRVFISILPPPRFPLSTFFHRVDHGCIVERFEDVVGDVVDGVVGMLEGT